MPQSGPEKRFSKKLRDALEAAYPNSKCVLLQDAYRGGVKPCDFFWFVDGYAGAFELKCNNTQVSSNQWSSLGSLNKAGIFTAIIYYKTKLKQIVIYSDMNRLLKEELVLGRCLDAKKYEDVCFEIYKALRNHYSKNTLEKINEIMREPINLERSSGQATMPKYEGTIMI